MTSTAVVVGPVSWRTRLLGGYFRKWVILGGLIGIVAGLGAIAFYEAIALSTRFFLTTIAGGTPPLPRGEGVPEVHHMARAWLIPVVTTVGGLLSGIIVFTFAPEAEGHGTDAAIEAFHRRGGQIRSRIPLVKLVASAITIGSGGSAGREGPTAQIAAGFGSWLGDLFHLTPEDRRIAVAVGVGAGIGAIFKAPLGGAILAGEILYIRDFEVGAIIPGFIASVIGYCIFATWSGWSPVFGSGLGLVFNHPRNLVWYAALGLAAGVFGIAYVRVFYGVRDASRRVPLPRFLKPAIGGLAVGLIGLAFPQVLSMGYGWLQLAIDGNTAQLAVGTMLALVALKIVATSLTIGTGGSGGVFAPGLFIGGMLGGGMWGILHGHVGWLPATPAPFVIVGMMALFGGVAKAPIAVILMVAEMTGEFSMIVPAMLATGIAYFVTGNTRIYENQLPTRADSPAHRGEYTIPLIQALDVRQAMRRDVVTASPAEEISLAEDRMAEHGLRGLPVLEADRLLGMITTTDALLARQRGEHTVAEAMSTNLIVVHPDESLHSALQRMARSGISRLPVVDRHDPTHLLGILTIRDLALFLDAETISLVARSGLGQREDPFRKILVIDAMRREFVSFPGSLSIKDAAARLAESGQHAGIVLDEGGAIDGIVTIRDIESAAEVDPDKPIGSLATRPVVVARQLQSVAEALAQTGSEGLRQLPVVMPRDGQLIPVGMLSRADVLAAYLRRPETNAAAVGAPPTHN